MNEYFDHEDAKRFFKISTVAVGLLALFLAAKSLSALKDWQAPSVAYATIAVSGQGEAYATPDIGSFSFSVSTDAKTVSEAQSQVTAKTDAVLAALGALNIEDKDIKTTDYSVYPKYTYLPAVCTANYCPPSRQVPDGYTVTHSVTVKVRKVDDAGKALSAAGENGATNISSLSFTVEDPNKIQNEARDKAIKDAKSKAEALAKSLGVRLGRVVDFSDSSATPGPYPVAYSMEAGRATDAKAPTLPVGENKVTDSVNVTYEIR